MAPGHPDYGRARLALLLVGVATLGLMYAPQPLLPVISEQYALSAAHASWLMSAVTLGVAVGVLPLGAVSAQWGRGRMIVAGLALATVAGLSLGVLTPCSAHGIWAYCVLVCFLRQLGVWHIYCCQAPHLFDLEWSRPLVWNGWLRHAGLCTHSPSAAWLCIRGFTTQPRSGGLPRHSS